MPDLVVTPVSIDQANDGLMFRRGDPGSPEAFEFLVSLWDTALGTKLIDAITLVLGEEWQTGGGGGSSPPVGGGGYSTPQELIDALFAASTSSSPPTTEDSDMVLSFKPSSSPMQLSLFNLLLAGPQVSSALQALSTIDRDTLLSSLLAVIGPDAIVGTDASSLAKAYPVIPGAPYTYAEIVAAVNIAGKILTLDAYRSTHEVFTHSVLTGTLDLVVDSTHRLNNLIPVGATNATVNMTVPVHAKFLGHTGSLMFKRDGATTGAATVGSGFGFSDEFPALTSSKVPLGGVAGTGGADGDIVDLHYKFYTVDEATLIGKSTVDA
jgi:hypothetical protein